MVNGWTRHALAGCLIALSACSTSVESSGGETTPRRSSTSSQPAAPPTTSAPDTATPTTSGPDTAPTTTPSEDVAPETTELGIDAGTVVDIHDPACVVTVEEFDSLGLIADRFDDETVNVVALRAENGLPDADIDAGQLLDVCVGNGLDDITGAQRTDPDEQIVAAAVKQNVEVQQLKLNRLFEDLGTPPLLVDGVSGPVTRQRLCAARLALGLPTSTDDMVAGTEEEQMLFATDELPIPFTSSINSDRWVLIDRTCQIMFVGEGAERLTYVFPTSTGSAGHETRDQDRSRAFRFDPAADNGGWHDSSDFPVAADNPLNGNMYRPLYFDLGQAIHGANNVPTSPQSKGCARLRVSHQDLLVDWLDLENATAPIWSTREIGVTVNVQGDYRG